MMMMLASPLLLLCAVGIKLSSKGPVLFTQTRVGRDRTEFTLYKLRTMHIDPNAGIETERGDPRVFRVGRILREFHLDELPQLWNVLRGDMSIVGPRPTIPEQVARYSEHEMKRLRVRPGLTGLAQVSGGNELTWEDRIELDIEYTEHATLLKDMGLLVKTVKTVLLRQGLYNKEGKVLDKSEPYKDNG
jgi:lipopolysaccharide/colanic/teichoic acid biosynthesis glycosyltransferase